MKIRLNEDGSIDRYKATFYEDEVITIAQCLNFVLGLIEEGKKKGNKPFVKDYELDRIEDVANKCNRLVSKLPKEEE